MDQISQIAVGVGVATLFHPVAYAKVLIQLGHEPIAPVASKGLFGGKILIYPNIFKYMQHIKRTDGWLGLYRGLGPKFAASLINNYVASDVQTALLGPKHQGEEEFNADKTDALCKMLSKTGLESVSLCAGILVSHPLHVIFVRQVAQFVGRETTYNSVWSSISEIWEQEGFLGFFAGLAPRVVGEVLTLWLTNILVHTIETFVLSTQPREEAKKMKGYTMMVVPLIVTQVTYPFNLVSNIMCVNSSRLAVRHVPTYTSWLNCWKNLKAEGETKRGSSMFWRQYKEPRL